MLNTMYFRRANKVMLGDVVYAASFKGNKQVVSALDKNLRTLGYTLHGELAEELLNVSQGDMKRIFDAIIAEVKEIRGVRNYRPVYPNFPIQVMEAREAELYWNAIVHYWSGGSLLPVYEKEERPVLDFDEDKFTVIRKGDFEDFTTLVNNLVRSKSGFSETDKEDIKAVATTFARMFAMIVGDGSSLTNRENKAFIAAVAHSVGAKVLPNPKNTATDVLRFAVALSDGDTSLSEDTMFRNFKRPERRMLLAMLDVVGNAEEDMQRHQQTWKRLGEKLHPGEYASQFPNAAAAFAAVRENNSVETFNAKVEDALRHNNMHEAVALLKTRPGDFARRLDHVLRSCDSYGKEATLIAFQGVAPKVSPTVLIQTRNAFINRDKAQRVFFPKGSVAKMQVMRDERSGISKSFVASVVNIIDNALASIFGERKSLGGVYVDPALKGIAVPFGMRNASKSLKTLGRGSRLPLDAGAGVVRFFIWWKNAEFSNAGYSAGHTDIDLSAVCLNDKFQNVFDITYYNLRERGAVHSGDITNAPNGASEFIDIDIERLKSQGVRYVAMTLYSYSGQGFVELPECFAGFMERKDLDSGEIYDPRTVTNKVDLAADSKSATPFIFDLETGEAIWVDLTMKVQPAYANAYNSREVTKSVAQAMVELTPPNLYDLFVAHATARGGLVSKDKAVKVYSLDGDVTPFDTEEILANYL